MSQLWNFNGYKRTHAWMRPLSEHHCSQPKLDDYTEQEFLMWNANCWCLYFVWLKKCCTGSIAFDDVVLDMAFQVWRYAPWQGFTYWTILICIKKYDRPFELLRIMSIGWQYKVNTAKFLLVSMRIAVSGLY